MGKRGLCSPGQGAGGLARLAFACRKVLQLCNDYGNNIPYTAYLEAFSQEPGSLVRFPRAAPNLEPRDRHLAHRHRAGDPASRRVTAGGGAAVSLACGQPARRTGGRCDAAAPLSAPPRARTAVSCTRWRSSNPRQRTYAWSVGIEVIPSMTIAPPALARAEHSAIASACGSRSCSRRWRGLPGVAVDCGGRRRRPGRLRGVADAAGRWAWAAEVRAGSNGAFQINLWVPDPAPARDRRAKRGCATSWRTGDPALQEAAGERRCRTSPPSARRS